METRCGVGSLWDYRVEAKGQAQPEGRWQGMRDLGPEPKSGVGSEEGRDGVLGDDGMGAPAALTVLSVHSQA